MGAGKAVKWPAANSIGGKGNEGVAGQVKAVSGAIGYVEYAYAFQNKIPFALLKNKAGKFVDPSIETFQAAAANADWTKAPKGFSLMLNNQPGEPELAHRRAPPTSWCIKISLMPAKAKPSSNSLIGAYKHGADMAKNLHYVPLPENVVKLVEADWAKEIKSGGKPLWP